MPARGERLEVVTAWHQPKLRIFLVLFARLPPTKSLVHNKFSKP
jgi:hypothetical protein